MRKIYLNGNKNSTTNKQKNPKLFYVIQKEVKILKSVHFKEDSSNENSR